ncbi:hypothetical protein SAMN04488514_11925 [Kriegella aquimaris]|uniref:Uncharacterized protein n=1 Tax=Kriegella aquimaris TaxID=192904 RepID=A0A1G9XUN6_9FLAO|nr:hypothetical protein SAMN04488514_11925 [Kriegella aquimaris]
MICTASERLHPRDLFDVKYQLKNEGFTYEIKKASSFVYIAAKSLFMKCFTQTY